MKTEQTFKGTPFGKKRFFIVIGVMIAIIVLCLLAKHSGAEPKPKFLSNEDRRLIESMERDGVVAFDLKRDSAFVDAAAWRALDKKNRESLAILWAKHWADFTRFDDEPEIIIYAADTQKKIASYNTFDGFRSFPADR